MPGAELASELQEIRYQYKQLIQQKRLEGHLDEEARMRMRAEEARLRKRLADLKALAQGETVPAEELA